MTREEAINLIKQVLPCLNIDEKIREGFVTLIPELKESEDERIRKELIGYLTHRAEVTGFIDEDKDCKRWIAYLEKQKEQKPVDEQFPPLEGLDKIKAKYYDDGFKNGFDEGVESVKSAEWSEKCIADIFEKVGLAKIVREQGNDALINAIQSAMIELSKIRKI